MRIVELSKVTRFGCARGTNLPGLYGQIGLTKATFRDKVGVCEGLADVARFEVVYQKVDLRVGVSSGASRGFLLEGNDLLTGSGDAEAIGAPSLPRDQWRSQWD